MMSLDILRAVAQTDEELLYRAEKPVRLRKTIAAIVSAAACFALVIALAAVLIPQFTQKYAPPVPDTDRGATSGDGAPQIVVDGTLYLISSHPTGEAELPDGYSSGGTVSDGGEFDGWEYFCSDEYPYIIYVKNEAVGGSGPFADNYVRFVQQWYRGVRLVRYGGSLYAGAMSTYSDLSKDSTLRDEVAERYGIQIEGEAPDGFVPVGSTEFEGYDSIPTGELGSNLDAPAEVYANPADPQVLLVARHWYTSPLLDPQSKEQSEVRHDGFEVYYCLNG